MLGFFFLKTLRCLKHSTNARARLIRRSHGFQMVFRYLTLTNEAFAVIAEKKGSYCYFSSPVLLFQVV